MANDRQQDIKDRAKVRQDLVQGKAKILQDVDIERNGEDKAKWQDMERVRQRCDKKHKAMSA